MAEIKNTWSTQFSQGFQKFESLDVSIFGYSPTDFKILTSTAGETVILEFIEKLLKEYFSKSSIDLSTSPSKGLLPVASAPAAAAAPAALAGPAADDIFFNGGDSSNNAAAAKELKENKEICDLFEKFGQAVSAIEKGEIDIQTIGGCVRKKLIEMFFMNDKFTIEDRDKFTGVFTLKYFTSKYYKFPSELSRSVNEDFRDCWSSINKSYDLLPRNDDTPIPGKSIVENKNNTRIKASDEERVKALITVTGEVTVKAASIAFWKFKNAVRMRIKEHYKKVMDNIFIREGENFSKKRKINTNISEGSTAKKTNGVSKAAEGAAASSSSAPTLASFSSSSKNNTSSSSNPATSISTSNAISKKSKQDTGESSLSRPLKRTAESESESDILQAYETAKASAPNLKDVPIDIKCDYDKCIKLLLKSENILNLVMDDKIAKPTHICCIIGCIKLYNYIFMCIGCRHPKFEKLESITLLVPSEYDKQTSIFIETTLQILNMHIRVESKQQWKHIETINQSYNGDIRKVNIR